MPPESCHGWWFSKPVSSTSSSISPHARRAPGAAPAEHLERQRDVLRDGAPVEEHGRLEDDPVVAVDAGLVRRLPVHGDPPGRRLDEVADDPQQRRLAAARRPDQRDELARLDRRGRCPAARPCCPRGNVFVDAGAARRRRVMRRAPARAARSASRRARRRGRRRCRGSRRSRSSPRASAARSSSTG